MSEIREESEETELEPISRNRKARRLLWQKQKESINTYQYSCAGLVKECEYYEVRRNNFSREGEYEHVERSNRKEKDSLAGKKGLIKDSTFRDTNRSKKTEGWEANISIITQPSRISTVTGRLTRISIPEYRSGLRYESYYEECERVAQRPVLQLDRGRRVIVEEDCATYSGNYGPHESSSAIEEEESMINNKKVRTDGETEKKGDKPNVTKPSRAGRKRKLNY